MKERVNVALAGAGAFGVKHLEAMQKIEGVRVVSLVGRELDKTREVAQKFDIEHVATNLEESLARKDVDAVVLCTPTQMHAAQGLACMKAGKHVQIEIPLADSWEDAQKVAALQRQTGLVCMVGHTRRFNPSHQWVQRRIRKGELKIQQMDVQTFFFRRTNGSPALASRRAHRRSLPLPDGRGDCVRARIAGPETSDARHCDGHVDPDEDDVRRDLHAVSIGQQ